MLVSLRRKDSKATLRNVIVIGGSAGGMVAVQKIVKDLPGDIPSAIVLLLHCGEKGSGRFSTGALLKRFGHLNMTTVTDGMALQEGTLAVLPPKKTGVFRDGVIYLDEGTIKDYGHESINRLFASAAAVYGARTIGVVLSGMLRDGTQGLRAIAQVGGVTVVQNPADAQYSGMPASALEDWPVTFCLNVSEIGPALDLLSRRKAGLETGVAVAVRLLKDRLALLVRLLGQSKENEETARYLRIEMQSLQHDFASIQELLPQVLTDIR